MDPEDTNEELMKNEVIVPTVTSTMKWWLAIVLALVTFLLFNPGTLRLVNGIFTSIHMPSVTNETGITWFGTLVMSLLYLIIIRVILW